MTHRVLTGLLGVLLVLTLAPVPVQASVIVYHNGPPNQVNGNEITKWIQAEDFEFAQPIRLTDIHFWSLEGTTDYQGSIAYTIYSDGGGAPGAVLAREEVNPTTRIGTGVSAFGLDEYAYGLNITPIFLTPGTYWLGLHNGPLTTSIGANFYWETTAANATLTGREDETPFDVDGWSATSSEHAFYLTGDPVPEPGTLFLIGTGITGLGLLRRRQRR
jgi:hypothetical protein